MTPAEKALRDAAAQADIWAEKAEKAGRLEDAATLSLLASAALSRATSFLPSPSAPLSGADNAPSLPPPSSLLPSPSSLLPPPSSPDPSTRCCLCGRPGIRTHHGLLIACTNPDCPRHGTPVAATVF